MQKKQKKGYVEITLVKDNCNSIVINCPEKIKLNFIQLYLAVVFGCPALDVEPKDWKGAGLIYGTFFGAFLACALFASVNAFLAILALLGLMIANAIITKNYFLNYIKKLIAAGYVPKTENDKHVLENAGIYVPNSNTVHKTDASIQDTATTSTVTQTNYSQELEKLAELKDKGILTQEEFESKKKKILEKM